MTVEQQEGYTQAMTEVMSYATSMVETSPNPLTWLDVAMYAQTSIMDVEDALEIEEEEETWTQTE